MTESQPDQELISLQAQLASVVAAMNMHIERAEKLAAESERLQQEIGAIVGGSQA
jgi:capsule polysaccharide export protein KpsE/RkpR